MSSGYNIPLVTALCDISPDVFSMSRSEQVEHLSSIREADIGAARLFYARNHVTSGMSEFLRGAVKRLSGQSQQAVFELRQAMGGGKTHNMIALGLLARFPELRELLPEAITAGMVEEPAVIATVNGRDVHNFIWGDIAEQLGRAEEFRDHWVSGPKAMSEGDWMRLIGDRPTLIMLDELPPYLAVAHTQTVGQGTLLDLLKYSIANLFSAAMKLKRCVVVVASLDAAYDEARRILGGQLADLQKETSRGAKSITPVDLNTGEIYDILRKRLFTKLPDPDGDEVDRVSQAYLATYQEAVRGRALAKSAEQMADEIVGSYPFHPSYKDILSLFKENEKFRQTRGLIQFTANLMRGVWGRKDREEVFLIGAQFLDFSDQEIVHEIRDEVERQIKDMIGLNDQMDAARGENIFNDADLQMAGYAAALRVLTAYTKIDGQDMTREALRPRKKGEKTLVDELTEFAVQTANEFLVPDGLERELWLELNGAERFYLKMMDIEEAGEAKLDQFQNFAKAFRVGDYDDLMASKTPNNAKLKTAIKLGKSSMAEGTPFGRDSIVRLTLRAIWRIAKEDEVEEVLEELREFIPDYLRKRDTLRAIAAYVAAKRGQSDPEEASAARILGTAIQTERI